MHDFVIFVIKLLRLIKLMYTFLDVYFLVLFVICGYWNWCLY